MERDDICGSMASQQGCDGKHYQQTPTLSPSSDSLSLLTPSPTPEDSSVLSKQPTFIKKLHKGFTKLSKVCSLLPHCPANRFPSSCFVLFDIVEETEGGDTMDDIKLRQKKVQRDNSNANLGGLSEEWKKRLTDYQFLSGQQELPSETRRRSVFCRKSLSKRSRRNSVTGTSKRSKNSDQGYQCGSCKMVVHKSCMSSVSHCHGCPPPTPAPHQVNPPAALQYPFNHRVSSCRGYPGYGNLQGQVQEYPWWAERMSRDDAKYNLSLSPNGTFLVRWSDRHEKLILSLKASGEVKHMRVFRQDDTGYLYLSEARYFRTIMELISFYKEASLSECFTGLDCVLRRPLYDTAVVKFPYEGTGATHLSLLPGMKVVILSREGENRGWWKGRTGDRMGYFPKEYVTVEDSDFMAPPW